MKYYIVDQIFQIKQTATSLLEAVENLVEDVNSSPFNFNDAQGCFEEVTEHIEKLKLLLNAEYEEEI